MTDNDRKPGTGHSVSIVFGEKAVRLHENGVDDMDALCEWGDVVTCGFGTKPELDAFMKGIEMAIGWMGHCRYVPGNRKVKCDEGS